MSSDVKELEEVSNRKGARGNGIDARFLHHVLAVELGNISGLGFRP